MKDIVSLLEEINSYAAYVGCIPLNISVGTKRLGLRSALLTGVGEDPVGDFMLNFLKKEEVDTHLTVRKEGKRSSAVILGIEPPDKCPLVYYRDNCADSAIDTRDIANIPLHSTPATLVIETGR